MVAERGGIGEGGEDFVRRIVEGRERGIGFGEIEDGFAGGAFLVEQEGERIRVEVPIQAAGKHCDYGSN